MIVGALGCAAIYLWAFEAGRATQVFPILPSSSTNAVLLAVSYVTMFLLAEGAFAVVAVREHMQDVLGLTDAEVITGVPRSPDQIASPAPAPSWHPGIGVFSERSERVVPIAPVLPDETGFRSEVDRSRV